MEPICIVAILDRSVGNETVGDMWQETKVFDCDVKIIEVLKWAATQCHTSVEAFRGNLKLTIAQ